MSTFVCVRACAREAERSEASQAVRSVSDADGFIMRVSSGLLLWLNVTV